MSKPEASYPARSADTALEAFDRDLIALTEMGLIEVVESADGQFRFTITPLGRGELHS